jgi:transcriptional regulator with XRE-family HTH domain
MDGEFEQELLLVRQAFGRALRKLRDERGLSIMKLAAVSKCNHSYIGELEQARHDASLKTMLRLRRGLRISWRQLFRAIEEELRAGAR